MSNSTHPGMRTPEDQINIRIEPHAHLPHVPCPKLRKAANNDNFCGRSIDRTDVRDRHCECHRHLADLGCLQGRKVCTRYQAQAAKACFARSRSPGHCHCDRHRNSCSLHLRGQFVVCKATAEPEVVCPDGSSCGTSDAGRNCGRRSRG